MLVFDAIMIFLCFNMQKELQECLSEKDWLGASIMFIVFFMALAGTVLLNVAYYGH